MLFYTQGGCVVAVQPEFTGSRNPANCGLPVTTQLPGYKTAPYTTQPHHFSAYMTQIKLASTWPRITRPKWLWVKMSCSKYTNNFDLNDNWVFCSKQWMDQSINKHIFWSDWLGWVNLNIDLSEVLCQWPEIKIKSRMAIKRRMVSSFPWLMY